MANMLAALGHCVVRLWPQVGQSSAPGASVRQQLDNCCTSPELAGGNFHSRVFGRILVAPALYRTADIATLRVHGGGGGGRGGRHIISPSPDGPIGSSSLPMPHPARRLREVARGPLEQAHAGESRVAHLCRASHKLNRVGAPHPSHASPVDYLLCSHNFGEM